MDNYKIKQYMNTMFKNRYHRHIFIFSPNIINQYKYINNNNNNNSNNSNKNNNNSYFLLEKVPIARIDHDLLFLCDCPSKGYGKPLDYRFFRRIVFGLYVQLSIMLLFLPKLFELNLNLE
uniref:Protein TIC 214 n=1 Tax=Heterorhabditis bacteriophora TaxID=37862 RepID=A0A1I7WFC7_HETBA